MTIQQKAVYQLAENLSMTVNRMLCEMTMAEYFGWMRFYAERNKEAELDAKGIKRPPPPSPSGEVIMRGFDLGGA